MEQSVIDKCGTKAEAVREIYGYDNSRVRKEFDLLVSEKGLDVSKLTVRPFKYKIVTKVCPVCGEKFETQEGHSKEKQTCSHSCSNTYFRSGRDNGRWEGSAYRTTCFLYHEKVCVICGEDKIVSVHHFDENNQNHNPENLIPMCPTHHQYWHSRYKEEVEDVVVRYRDHFIKNGCNNKPKNKT